MPDKFENATLRAKTEQMFCVLGGCLLSKFQNTIFFAMLITWEDKLHDKTTSAYSKSYGLKKFSVHTNTKKYRFQIVCVCVFVKKNLKKETGGGSPPSPPPLGSATGVRGNAPLGNF